MSVLWRVRAAVLALVGVLALHHARYALVPPTHEHGGPESFAAAHAYLAWLAPVTGALLFVIVVHFAAALRRVRGAPPGLPPGRTLWAAATATLLAVYAGQETVESWLTHGYRPELLASFTAGGWIAVPLAGALGGLIALSLRGAARVVGWALARAARRLPRLGGSSARPATTVVLVPLENVLARFLAGRGPPVLS